MRAFVRHIHTGIGLDTFWVYTLELLGFFALMLWLGFDVGWPPWAAFTAPTALLGSWWVWVFRAPR